MGKANKVKTELVAVTELVNLIQTLKDIADNKFYILTSQKDRFKRFGESFVEFFRMLSLSTEEHPLIKNDNPTTGILVVTAEGSFLGAFNNRIIRLALEEKEKHENVRFTVVGERGIDRFKEFTPDLKSFINMEGVGIYETAVEIKNYLIEEVEKNRLGKVNVVYSWPKSFDSQRPRVLKLLPCDELLTKQAQYHDEFEHIIEESTPVATIGYLANLWITTRLYEILMDTIIAASAAQSKFLDDSVDKMKKERAKTSVKYRKAKKSDIDKSLRETFSARMMVTKN